MPFVLIAHHEDGRNKVQYPPHETQGTAESVARSTIKNFPSDITHIDVYQCSRVEWDSEDGKIISPRYITTYYRKGSWR